jgi:hypothetical protein
VPISPIFTKRGYGDFAGSLGFQIPSEMTITIVPEPPQIPRKRSWLDTVGMFEDDADFEAMVQAGRAIREADRQAAREEADREAL